MGQATLVQSRPGRQAVSSSCDPVWRADPPAGPPPRSFMPGVGVGGQGVSGPCL